MGFKAGIVGLPNVGKSTLFNALTQANIQAANYPFCTIEPNSGMVPVPDPRLDTLATLVNPQRVIPTTLQLVDIAGLVAGAAQGEGLGNQFLSHIRETDAIVHLVRCFENDDIIHVNGHVDPLSDIEIINTELALADLDMIEKSLLKVSKLARAGDKKALADKELLEKIKSQLERGHCVRLLNLSTEEKTSEYLRHLITLKPVLYVANVDETGFNNNPHLDKVRAHAAKEQANVVAICAAIEAELAELSLTEKKEFLHELGLEEPGLNRLIRAGHDLLQLQTYFTAGVKEVRAWTIPIGASAPKAAAEIHTDFEKGFIRAEVMSFDDFVHYKGESGCRTNGKLRTEGKTYIVQDGDVMHFLFNV